MDPAHRDFGPLPQFHLARHVPGDVGAVAVHVVHGSLRGQFGAHLSVRRENNRGEPFRLHVIKRLAQFARECLGFVIEVRNGVEQRLIAVTACDVLLGQGAGSSSAEIVHAQ